MPEAPRRVFVAVSRFNEAVTRRLLDGARGALAARGVPGDALDVVWVPGAFELPLAVHRALATGRYRCAVALGALVRGETPHFEVIAAEATRGLGEAALRHGMPVGFGLLTTDTLEQAIERAGGTAGDKGAEAALAALETAEALERLAGDAAS
jgi:6,7-dimethyl-8-ribityllumazine synthase